MLPATWRYKRFHISYLLSWLGLGLLVGLIVGKFAPLFAGWFIAAIALTLAMASLRSRRWYACVFIVVSGMLLGYLRGATFAYSLHAFDGYSGASVTIVGKIEQDPVLKEGSNVWQAELSDIRIENKYLSGGIYATIVSDEALKRGDTVTISGKVLDGFGSFQASLYRAQLQHVSRPNDPFLAARDSFAEAVRRVMPEPEASLGLGFVVGQKSALPDDFAEQLKTVGLTHVVVASGYNLTILVRFARRLLARRSRYLALVGSGLLVVGFVLVSGFSASMNRAAVVTALSLLAWYYGRKFHPIQLILYVAALSALMNPLYVWGDLGWLLSFAAFTGVLVVGPIITKLLYGSERKPSPVVQLVIETLSAEIMTLPIIIISFGYIPVFALLANILVAPVIPFAMLLTFIAGIVGWVAPALSLLAAPATILIAYVVAIVKWLANPEWARLPIDVSAWLAIVWYGTMLLAGWTVWRRHKVDLLASNVVE